MEAGEHSPRSAGRQTHGDGMEERYTGGGQDVRGTGGPGSGQDMRGTGGAECVTGWGSVQYKRGPHYTGGPGSGQDMRGPGGADYVTGSEGTSNFKGPSSISHTGDVEPALNIGGPQGPPTPHVGVQVNTLSSSSTDPHVGGTGYPVLVQLPYDMQKFSLKILKYFASKSKSGGDEYCSVMEISPSTYRVYFRDEEAQVRVLNKKDHVIESMHVHVTIGEDVESDELQRHTEAGRGSDDRGHDSPEFREGNDGSSSHPANVTYTSSAGSAEDRSSHFPEIFSDVSIRLNTGLIDGETIQEIRRKFPSLEVTESKVVGSYGAIEKLHNFLQEKLGAGVRRTVHKEEPEEDVGDDCLNLQTTLYNYVAEIYKEEVTKIESRFNVKITEVKRSKDISYIKVKPVGADSFEKRAKEMFITQIQDVTKDWSQKEAPISAMKASLESTKQYMKKHHKTLVIKDGDRLLLLGPERELTLAMEGLQKVESRSPLPRRVITITSKDMKSEVIVDPRHMDILKKLKSRELEDLQEKYRVRMNEEGKDKNLSVTFRAVNGAPDLGVHACHSFSNLLQSTVMNLQRKSVNLQNGAERLAEFSAMLQKGGIDVILEHDQGSVTLIASPVLVDLAEEKLREFFQLPDARRATASGGDTHKPMDTSHAPDKKTSAEEEKCPICLDQIQNRKVLPKCKHEFCDVCLQKALSIKPMCPLCFVPYGLVIGNQPEGTMSDTTTKEGLPGFPECGTIQISYNIPGGTQQKDHPNPGKRFSGTQRIVYLPDNQEGREVLRLLKKAFKQKLIFTVGESRTTGSTDTVTWNDIHHKTSKYGGPTSFGYPDPDYLKRVRDELKAKGIE